MVGHGEYENVNIEEAGLAMAATASVKGAAHFGANMAVTCIFGRLGLIVPVTLLGNPGTS